MAVAIAVESLSKKYIIGHQPRERYTALRDVLANGAKRLAGKLAHPFAQPEDDATHETFWALKDVGFTIQQGDRVALMLPRVPSSDTSSASTVSGTSSAVSDG